APMICAGITAFSPLVHNRCGQGKKVGINGIGGLGHMSSSAQSRWVQTLSLRFGVRCEEARCVKAI
ncbi:hypothetical protein V1522DRAFT_357513, partial [Lipomyces starkeyi]